LLPEGAPRQSMMQELKAIRELLNAKPAGRELGGGGAIERVAAIVIDQLGVQPGEQPRTAGTTPTEETVHL
jgi:hypothetical protein